MNSENWEQLPPLPDMEAELKKIRRDLRRRSIKIVLISLVLVAAMLFGIVQYGIPALEKQYWDPNTSTYLEDITDLELTMRAYSELFCPGYEPIIVDSVKTGFATHSITATFSNWTGSSRKTGLSQKNAILSTNDIIFPAGFWENTIGNAFNLNAEETIKLNSKNALSALKKYPDYIDVLAAVHFPEDLDMDEINAFCDDVSFNDKGRADDGRVIWVSIRNRAAGDPWRPACGFEPNTLESTSDWVQDSEYPFLDSYGTVDSIDLHFKSMLRFLQDQLDKGTGILPPDGNEENYYANVLNYVEENGVMAYGAYIIAAPGVLLELCESGQIDGITLCDAWIRY